MHGNWTGLVLFSRDNIYLYDYIIVRFIMISTIKFCQGFCWPNKSFQLISAE